VFIFYFCRIMSFLVGFIQTLLDGLGVVYWKKALSVSKVSQEMFALYAKLFWIFLLVFFSIAWLINFHIFVDIKAISIMFFLTVLLTVAFVVRQQLYLENKISQMAPFENLNKLFSIIAGFLLYQNASFFSFLVAIIAVIVVIIFNIDWKKFTFPKSLGKIFFVQVCFTVNTLLIAYILKDYSNIDVTMLEMVVGWLVIILFFVKLDEIKQIHTQPFVFYKYRFLAAFFWILAYIVWLFLLKNVGVVLSILLSFLWMWVTLLMSYVFFKDKPAIKDIVLSIVLLFFIALGFYFNYQ